MVNLDLLLQCGEEGIGTAQLLVHGVFLSAMLVVDVAFCDSLLAISLAVRVYQQDSIAVLGQGVCGCYGGGSLANTALLLREADHLEVMVPVRVGSVCPVAVTRSSCDIVAVRGSRLLHLLCRLAKYSYHGVQSSLIRNVQRFRNIDAQK